MLDNTGMRKTEPTSVLIGQSPVNRSRGAARSSFSLSPKHDRRTERPKLDFLVSERMQENLINEKIRNGCII